MPFWVNKKKRENIPALLKFSRDILIWYMLWTIESHRYRERANMINLA